MRHKLDKTLMDLLQRDITLTTNNKTIKQGKLINYVIHDYVVTITLKNHKNQLKNYDVYYPYDMRQSRGMCILDYRVCTLVGEQTHLSDMIDHTRDRSTRQHKLFDNCLTIQY